MYEVYILEKDGKPVYVGVTSNIQRRLRQHIRSQKVFDFYKIIYTTKIKKDALLVENSLIKFMSIYLDGHYNASQTILLINKNI